MSDIVGIDLGTTNSLIGIMDAGFPILLADASGKRLTPSVVHFGPEEPLVGYPAARLRTVAPAATIYSIKRFVGRRWKEADGEKMPYALEPGENGGIAVRTASGSYTPEQISALILSHLKRNAEEALGRAISRAVITVPAYFNDAQRGATKRAGELAGFTVERIVNEPTAAALAYGLDRLGEKSRIAVYDLGGGTFDISILELNEGVFQVISTNGNTRLGGDDIDSALIAHLIKRIGTECGMGEPSLSPEAVSRIWEAAVELKHRLSTEAEATLELPFLAGAESARLSVTRAELEQVARPIVERTRAHCLRSLADAKLTPADLNEVILVGGVTRMPLVQAFVQEVFGRVPNVTQNPDEAVAAGATIQAGILSGAVQKMVLLDITPLSLGIETFGGLMNVIIPRNSTIPIKAGEMFTNAMPNQRSMWIHVLQGEREMARDNWSLGQFEIPFAPAAKGQARVGVQFEIDANGLLHVLARDTKTGAEKIVEIRSAVDVSDEAVELMIAESIEHAFDDMSERVLAEARMKSNEMLPAVRGALAQVGDELGAQGRARIAALVEEVESALKSGEVQRLKAANAALDEGTQQLAAILLERAMDESLRRKGVT